MKRRFTLRAWRWWLAIILATGVCETVSAKKSGEHAGPPRLDFFSAIESKTIAVKLIPRDSTRMTLQITNNTSEELVIQAPVAIVGVPVLAQFAPRGIADFAADNANPPESNQGPQVLGSGFPFFQGNRPGAGPNAQNDRTRGNNNPANGFNPGNGFFSIPPERTLRLKIAAVCLEFGKPDPKPRMAYEIRALDTFSDDPRLRELLGMLARDKRSQREIQLAAWHVANGKTWDELRKLRITHLNGAREPQFSKREIAAAQKIVSQLTAVPAPNEPSALTSSSAQSVTLSETAGDY